MGKGKHQKTDDSMCIIVIGTCFALLKFLYNLKLQMWFYYHKITNIVYPFVLEDINVVKLLTENMIKHFQVTNTNKSKSQIQASVGQG